MDVPEAAQIRHLFSSSSTTRTQVPKRSTTHCRQANQTNKQTNHQLFKNVKKLNSPRIAAAPESGFAFLATKGTNTTHTRIPLRKRNRQSATKTRKSRDLQNDAHKMHNSKPKTKQNKTKTKTCFVLFVSEHLHVRCATCDGNLSTRMEKGNGNTKGRKM